MKWVSDERLMGEKVILRLQISIVFILINLIFMSNEITECKSFKVYHNSI